MLQLPRRCLSISPATRSTKSGVAFHEQGNLGDMDGPVMLQKRLQSAQRVLKFITTNTVSVSIDALKTECR